MIWPAVWPTNTDGMNMSESSAADMISSCTKKHWRNVKLAKRQMKDSGKLLRWSSCCRPQQRRNLRSARVSLCLEAVFWIKHELAMAMAFSYLQRSMFLEQWRQQTLVWSHEMRSWILELPPSENIRRRARHRHPKLSDHLQANSVRNGRQETEIPRLSVKDFNCLYKF